MTDLFQSVSASSFLIVGGVGCYVIGFLFRDQLHIRLLVLTGVMFYILYYWTVAPAPLWDAIIGSALIGTASAQGAVQIAWSRSMISAPRDSRHILKALGDIEPGLFRRLMKIGERVEVSEPRALVTEGVAPDALWLLLEGEIILTKEGQAAKSVPGPCFVGEIAWLRGGSASATATARPGAKLLRWPHDMLRRNLRRSHRLELALEALIAQDLARKLSKSTPIASAEAAEPTPAADVPAS